MRGAVGEEDALWVQVEQGDPQAVEDAALAAIANLLPTLGVDVLSDVQVRHIAWLKHAVCCMCMGRCWGR